MAKKGHIIIEGAKAFCSSAQVIKNKGTAVPIKVTSQKKKLGKNKYFAQAKPIATYLDDKAENFNNGQAFVMCQDPKNTSTGYSPCKAKCNIKYKDYYENVEFNKSMKILLDVSTGTCMGYGVPGTIEFATTGQSNNVSQIDVKEADEFSVANTSPQWKTSDPANKTKTSVSSISMSLPFPVADLKEQTFFYIQKTNVNSWNFFPTTAFSVSKLTLTAQYKGDVTKIIWALFKGDGVKDKVKTFIGLGSTFNQELDKMFENLDEGKYRIEAYGGKPGDAKCSINIEIVRDFVKKITIPPSSTKNVPIPITLERKVGSPSEVNKVLNVSALSAANQSVYWRIKEKEIILYNSYSNTSSPNLVTVDKNTLSAVVTFKNKGKYTIEAFTNPNETKPESTTIDIKDSVGIETIDHGSTLLRYNDNFSVWVKGYNAVYIPEGSFRTVHWYLKKEGTGRIREFESSALFKVQKINKKINEFLFYDAKIVNGRYFGSYAIEAYASPLPTGKEPQFGGGDCLKFDVIKNVIDKFTLPATTIPKGTKIKYNAEARISPLTVNERITLEIPPNVTMNGEEKTLTFNELGEYSISAYLTGDYTENKKIETKITVSDPKIKRALWAYESGVKRTLSGYEEESYGFLEIEGLQDQSLKVKIWVRGDGDDFYKEKDKYLLEEKILTLNSEGKASFKITTDKTYKEKIEKAIPKTADNPNPAYQLIFTIELQAGTSAEVVLPNNVSIQGTRPVVIDATTIYLEVLDANEDLTITAEKKIVSIMFSTEDGKDIQRAQTFYGKSHKLWVHTVNMQEEKLKIDVFKEVPKEGLNESNHIVYTHESKETYKEEQVGKDGLLEVSFTPKEEWKNPPKNFDYYIAQASWLIVDPADNNKHLWKPEKIQITTNNTLPADLVRTEDMEKLGIKAHKQDGTAFTRNEMLELRKQFIFYESGCLKVSQLTTPEVIDNDVMPVVVEMAEVGKQKTCFCNRGFNDAEMEDLIKAMIGGTNIWQGIKERCDITDKTIKSLTAEMNAMFSHYEINRCMQKISFLANLAGETGFFKQSKEERSSYLSSQSVYKGRGILQITGEKDNTEYYNNAGPYKKYGKDRFGDENKFIGEKKADLISSNLHYAVDVGGWIFETKKAGTWNNPWTGSDAQYNSLRIEKHSHFSKGLGKNLIEIGLLIEEEEEKYFWLQAKMLNGYPKSHKLTDNPHSWSIRKDALTKLKTWFKYDKGVCNGDAISLPNLTGKAPWMDVAIAEAKIYGGKKEGNIDSRIKTYHKDGGGLDAGSGTAWCASFVCWCLEQKNYKSPHSAGSRMFLTSTDAEQCDVFYGAVAVFSDCDSTGTRMDTSGHCTFVFGKLPGSNIYAVLGGNQGDMLKMSPYDCSGNVFVSWKERDGTKHYKIFRGFYKPKGYIIKENDKLTTNDNYQSADKASTTALNLNIISNENGESSR